MPQEKKTESKIAVTPEVRKLWFPIRKAWAMSVPAFSNAVSLLSDAQASKMYDIVKLPLFKPLGEALRLYPGLKPILQTEDDRLCMFQVYEILSWRLGKKEKEPADVRLAGKLKGGIGRASPHIEL